MKKPETRQKYKAWAKSHPEIIASNLAARSAGNQRLQREKPTKLEKKLHGILTNFGIPFEPYALIKPKFIVDARVGNIIIQADGDYWHGHPRLEPLTNRQLSQQRRDKAQDAYLTRRGFTVIRIWESDLSVDLLRTTLQAHNLIMTT